MKVQVTIEGIVPLPMHRYPIETAGEVRRKEEIPTPEEGCERAMYKDEEGCYIPSTWISAMLVRAGGEVQDEGQGNL